VSSLVTKGPTNIYIYSIVAVHGLAGKDFDTWGPKTGQSLSGRLSSRLVSEWDIAPETTLDFQYEVRDAFTRTNGTTGIRKLALELLEEVYSRRVSLLRCTDSSSLM